MNPVELGHRLRIARETRELSQQAVADAIDVPRTAITQMEAGNRSVSTLELTRLAKLYRRPISYFFAEAAEPASEDVLVTLYRMEPGLKHDSNVSQEVERYLALFREGVALERVLGLDEKPDPPTYNVRTPRTTWEAVSQGERVADEERRRIGIGTMAIPDISELIGSQGIWASGTRLPNHMSGLFLRDPTVGLAILANAVHSRGRKRFSYAHEYAHALLDREQNITVSSIGNSGEKVEQRANAFAAAFLMPDEGVQNVLRDLNKGMSSRREQAVFDVASEQRIEGKFRSPRGSQKITYKDVALVAHHFGVSYQAAVYRLKSLKYISSSETTGLLGRETFGKDYLEALDMFEDVEEFEKPEYSDREVRNEIAHLAIEAYRREEVSRGRILEIGKMLGFRGTKLLDLAEVAREE